MDSTENSLFGFVAEQPQAAAPESFEEIRAAYMAAVEKRIAELPENLENADIRFSGALPLGLVRSKSIALIGAGGLGNWQWHTLVGMGFRTISVFDDDVVGIENVSPQGHSFADIGRLKVDCVKDEAMRWHGVVVSAVPRRVYGLSDIKEALGYMPDIVIVTVDNMKLRNELTNEVVYMVLNRHFSGLPELMLDYRMALGEWSAFAMPVRWLSRQNSDDRRVFCNKYIEQAVYDDEQAVQEPCTARSIIYTALHVAAYTGAFLHNWLTSDDFDTRDMMRTFSSRSFESTSSTRAEEKLRDIIDSTRRKCMRLEDTMAQLVGNLIQGSVERVSMKDLQPGDVLVPVGSSQYTGFVIEVDSDNEAGTLMTLGGYMLRVGLAKDSWIALRPAAGKFRRFCEAFGKGKRIEFADGSYVEENAYANEHWYTNRGDDLGLVLIRDNEFTVADGAEAPREERTFVIKGSGKSFTGRVIADNGKTVTLSCDGRNVEIPWDAVDNS